MKSIHIKLWFHPEDGTWSVVMGNIFKLHVSEAMVDELAEYALVAAKQELLERDVPSITLDNWPNEIAGD